MEPDPRSLDISSVNRRGFFRRILSGGLDRLEQTGRSLAHQARALTGPPPPASPEPVRLRPPGAGPESEFLTTCTRSGACVAACPAQCIRLDDEACGRPYIVARESPCVVCEDLSCMKACPSGALTLVPEASAIDMGLASMDQRRCLRNPKNGGGAGPAGGFAGCTECLDQCPMGESALGLDAYGRVQVRSGCVGCGVCERVCPTEPASIAVVSDVHRGSRSG
jgi:ferredoxin-type protein NapG